MRYPAGVAAIFAAVCIAVAAPVAAGPLVQRGKIDTLLLSDDEVGSIVGLPMHRDGKIYPAPSLAGPPHDCKVLTDNDSDLWTGEFSAYRQVMQLDNPDDRQFLVQQSVAMYPAVSTAAQTYQRSFPSNLVERCRDKVVPDPGDPHEQWRIDAVDVNSTGATWISTEIYDGQDVTWRCSRGIRVRINVLFLDVECQYGNGSPVMTQMIDTIADRITS